MVRVIGFVRQVWDEDSQTCGEYFDFETVEDDGTTGDFILSDHHYDDDHHGILVEFGDDGAPGKVTEMTTHEAVEMDEIPGDFCFWSWKDLWGEYEQWLRDSGTSSEDDDE